MAAGGLQAWQRRRVVQTEFGVALPLQKSTLPSHSSSRPTAGTGMQCGTGSQQATSRGSPARPCLPGGPAWRPVPPRAAQRSSRRRWTLWGCWAAGTLAAGWGRLRGSRWESNGSSRVCMCVCVHVW